MALPVGGIRRLLINGVAVDVIEVGSFSIATEKKETVEVQAGTPGHRVKPVVAHIEATISVRGIKVSDFIGQEGVTVQLDLANGRSYVWSDAVEVGDGTVDPADGKLTLRYESAKAKEL